MARSMRLLSTLSVVWIALFTLAACRNTPEASEHRYRQWLVSGHAEHVQAYEAFLQASNAGGVVPMPALLRTARRWRKCDREEFALPPQDLWPEMPPTLRLVERLKREGLIDPRLARSVYRDAELNRCAGGSAKSKHLLNRALDFDLPASPDTVARLCDFWRSHGEDAQMGLGFYTPTAIHIDTAGFRTWGEDYAWRTSLCTKRDESGGG
jgi:Peptidase M15